MNLALPALPDLLLPYVLLQLVFLAVLLVGQRGLKVFLATHAAINDPAALEAFKQLVRGQMYAALAIIVLGLVAILGSVALAFTAGLLGLVFVLVLSGVGFVLGKATKTLELRARTLPCAETFRAEYLHICETWKSKPLPRF